MDVGRDRLGVRVHRHVERRVGAVVHEPFVDQSSLVVRRQRLHDVSGVRSARKDVTASGGLGQGHQSVLGVILTTRVHGELNDVDLNLDYFLFSPLPIYLDLTPFDVCNHLVIGIGVRPGHPIYEDVEYSTIGHILVSQRIQEGTVEIQVGTGVL